MVARDIRDAIDSLVTADLPGVAVTVIEGADAGAKAVLDQGGSVVAGELPEDLVESVAHDARALTAIEMSVTLGYGSHEIFFEVFAPRPRLFVFGAVHIAQELVTHAALLGFRTIVADPRPAFVTEERFPGVDELRVGWPDDVCHTAEMDGRTFVVVLTHDRRFEDPLWPIALESNARYIGAMGSAKTTARRRDRLLRDGFTSGQVDRIHGPIGLSIGSRTAGETAIAIIAEMIATRYSVDQELELVGVPLRP